MYYNTFLGKEDMVNHILKKFWNDGDIFLSCKKSHITRWHLVRTYTPKSDPSQAAEFWKVIEHNDNPSAPALDSHHKDPSSGVME